MSEGEAVAYVIIYIVIFICLYLLPGIIAYKKERKNKLAILWATILLGWTGIGWIIALIWALTSEEKE
jgi:hypothetical protein